MRALLNFILRNHFFFVFLSLMMVSFWMLIEQNSFQRAAFINSSNSVTGGVYGTWTNITSYFYLSEDIRMLQEENARLRSLVQMGKGINEEAPVTVIDSASGFQYIYQPATVVSNSLNQRSNFMTLSVGSDEGIGEDMGVVNSKGIVGIVKSVSGHYAAAMSMLHKDTKISARFKRTGYIGVVQWNGEDPQIFTMVDVPLPAEIQKGDTVVTSGASAIFPKGLMVGTVLEHEVIPGDNFYTVTVRSAVDFGNLSHVYIVRNLHQEEQLQLQQSVINSEDTR